MTPEQRSLAAQVAVHTSWAKTSDRAARTLPARLALMDKFEREVDPNGVMDPATRAKAAENAKKAYFLALARKSAKSRAAAKAKRDAA